MSKEVLCFSFASAQRVLTNQRERAVFSTNQELIVAFLTRVARAGKGVKIKSPHWLNKFFSD